MARLQESMARTESALRELQRSNLKLEQFAAADPLTGAVNRKTFVDRIEREIERAKRGSGQFSLLALDLDNFRRINDRFGREVGDHVLRSIVDICLDAIRPYDGVARVAGAEFMVLIPRGALDAALMVGERIRAAVQATPFTSGSDGFSVTVSIGIALFAQDGATSDALMRAADERLSRAKNHGRNCVIAV